MQCKNCKYDHSEVVKVTHAENGSINRRRQCLKCGLRFTTTENPKVYKRDFDQNRNAQSK